MSRIGKTPLAVPYGVTVDISGQRVTVKGRLGELSHTVSDQVEVIRDGDAIVFKPRNDSLRAQKMWGTSRSTVGNLVKGVAEGFTRKLEINGVGYRAQVQGTDLVLQLGYSHEIRFPIPDGVSIACPEQNRITLSGADKQKVGQAAADVRGFRPPEPYKGKGIKYAGEIIRRKEGKKK